MKWSARTCRGCGKPHTQTCVAGELEGYWHLACLRRARKKAAQPVTHILSTRTGKRSLCGRDVDGYELNTSDAFFSRERLRPLAVAEDPLAATCKICQRARGKAPAPSKS